MSSTKVIANLRIDSVLKQQAFEIANQMGLSLSAVMSLLLRKFVLEKRIEIGLDENGFTPIKKTKMKTAISETRNDGKPFDSIQDLLDS
ncbi:MAG: type II toxin-antitoxin system RelB/DinJ family antitoxin [Candidatus Absconditabacteria bacterium]|nr:type II toxin-antitoxin system RelB/DinJ family antitoxin [Candidatus Absconditabacteria bacterium]